MDGLGSLVDLVGRVVVGLLGGLEWKDRWCGHESGFGERIGLPRGLDRMGWWGLL